MTQWMFRVLAVAGALFAPMGTAQPIPASQLLSQCERLMVVGKFKTDGTISLPGNETAAAGCLGYLSAIHDLVNVVETGTGKPLLGVCMPKGVQVDQVAQIFINYARARPERWHEDIRALLLPALHASFPCGTR
jgi:hypothetical protein